MTLKSTKMQVSLFGPSRGFVDFFVHHMARHLLIRLTLPAETRSLRCPQAPVADLSTYSSDTFTLCAPGLVSFPVPPPPASSPSSSRHSHPATRTRKLPYGHRSWASRIPSCLRRSSNNLASGPLWYLGARGLLSFHPLSGLRSVISIGCTVSA